MLVDHRQVARLLPRRGAPLDDAVLEADEVVRLAVVGRVADEVGRVAVQPEEVRRIDRVLHRLEPVAVDQRIDHRPALAVLPRQHVPARQERRRLGTEIGIEQAGELFHRVGALADAVLERAVVGLGRLLEAAPGAVEFPAVVGAADAFFVDPAVGERRAPVRAALRHQAVAPFFVLEQRQVFAQDSDRLDRTFIRQIAGHRDRMPVAAQQLARRRAGPDLGQIGVFFPAQHERLLYLAFIVSRAR